MMRSVVLFFMLMLVSLTAGRAFWVWLGENPADLSGRTYVEFFQVLDRDIAIPIAVTGIGGTILAGISALLFREQRGVCAFLMATCLCAAISSLVTIVVHLPINARIATWDPAALPVDYALFLQRWWQWQQVRVLVMCLAMGFAFVAVLIQERPSSRLP